MSKSKMVVATKFQLLVSKAQVYDKQGARKELFTRLVPRELVERDNFSDNQDYWVIDEEATSEAMEKRQQSIERQALEKQRSTVGSADMVEALQGLANPKATVDTASKKALEAAKKEADELRAKLAELEKKEVKEVVIEPENINVDELTAEDFEGLSIPELQKQCDEKGLKYHHKAKEAKLIELLISNQ